MLVSEHIAASEEEILLQSVLHVEEDMLIYESCFPAFDNSNNFFVMVGET